MSEVKIVQGSVEYLYADIRADRVLDTQAVFISISDTTGPDAWEPAQWVGSPGRYRSARLLLDGSLVPDLYSVFVRILDTPEAPITEVGKLRIV